MAITKILATSQREIETADEVKLALERSSTENATRNRENEKDPGQSAKATSTTADQVKLAQTPADTFGSETQNVNVNSHDASTSAKDCEPYDLEQNQNRENSDEFYSESEEGWIVKHKKTRSKKNQTEPADRTNLLKIPRPAPIKGENNNFTGLKVAQQTSFLFLSGLHPSVNADQVLKFIKESTDITCSCVKMRTRSDNKKSSFKLEVPTDSRPKIFSSILWGPGVIINHFLHLQRLPHHREEMVNQQNRK